jgi:hypothetical protein
MPITVIYYGESIEGIPVRIMAWSIWGTDQDVDPCAIVAFPDGKLKAVNIKSLQLTSDLP